MLIGRQGKHHQHVHRCSRWPDFCSSVLGLPGTGMASPYQLALDRGQSTINAESFHEFTFNVLESLSTLGFSNFIQTCSSVIFIMKTFLNNITLSISVSFTLVITYFGTYSHLTNMSVCVGSLLHFQHLERCLKLN